MSIRRPLLLVVVALALPAASCTTPEVVHTDPCPWPTILLHPEMQEIPFTDVSQVDKFHQGCRRHYSPEHCAVEIRVHSPTKFDVICALCVDFQCPPREVRQ